DGSATGQRQDHHLGVAGVEREFLQRLQFHYPQAALGPARRFGADVDGVRGSGAARGDVIPAVHAQSFPVAALAQEPFPVAALAQVLTIETAAATAELTSSSAG